jgi:signal peptidase I
MSTFNSELEVAMFKQRLKKFLYEWGVAFIVVISIFAPIRSVLADYNYIPSGSMKPTLQVGDNVFVNKLAYDLKLPFTIYRLAEWASPENGEIVVFYQPIEKLMMVKRVIGVPGDKISMSDNQLTINGKPLKYKIEEADKDLSATEKKLCMFYSEELNGKQHSIMEMPFSPSIQSFPEISVPEGKYFVMGDNRDNSNDSRFWGFVDRSEIAGRVEMILWSKPMWELSIPKRNRLFKKAA